MTNTKTLTARLITDADIIITAELVAIKGNFATINFEGSVKRCKVHTSYDGSKYILPYGKYSMAPAFRL
jgi:hypothetical protein